MKSLKQYILEADVNEPEKDDVQKITPPRSLPDNGFRYLIKYLGKLYALDFNVTGDTGNRNYRVDLHLLNIKDDPNKPKSVAAKLGMSPTSKNLDGLFDDLIHYIKDFTDRKKPNIIYFMPATQNSEFAKSSPLHAKIFDSLAGAIQNKKAEIGNYRIKRAVRDEIDDKILGQDLAYAFKMVKGAGQDMIRTKANLPKFGG